MPVENTYLAHTHAARWSPSADESAEEEQMSAINTHNQSLSGTHALISHFLYRKEVLLSSWEISPTAQHHQAEGRSLQVCEPNTRKTGFHILALLCREESGMKGLSTDTQHGLKWSSPPMSGVWEGILS